MSSNGSPLLSHLHSLVGDDLALTNRIILEKLSTDIEMIPTLGTHLISSGGKRLRPILTLLTSRMYGHQGEATAALAAVIEFIHTATLLHDDVVDDSHIRRGRATANAVWGSKAPVLVGDFLFSRSFQMLVEQGSMSILKVIADTCAVISEGEVLQLVVSNDLGITTERYLEVVTRKTAVLFAAAAQVGAVLAGQTLENTAHLAHYGTALGQAYQLVDDALDYGSTSETLGKSIGDDFQEGKITLPVIHAYHNSTEEEREFWRSALVEGHRNEDSLQQAIAILRKKGSLDYAMAKARGFVAEAIEAVAHCPEGPEKEALIMIADFSVDREF